METPFCWFLISIQSCFRYLLFYLLPLLISLQMRCLFWVTLNYRQHDQRSRHRISRTQKPRHYHNHLNTSSSLGKNTYVFYTIIHTYIVRLLNDSLRYWPFNYFHNESMFTFLPLQHCIERSYLERITYAWVDTLN